MNEAPSATEAIAETLPAGMPGWDPTWDAGMVPAVYRVENRHRELDDTVTLDMEPVAGACIRFLPGQFTMMGLPGIGEIPISVSGNPDRGDSLAQTVRAVGKVSRAITGLQIGDRVMLRGPFGMPWPVELALGKRLMIIAGGLGLAPVRPIVYWALANHDRLAGTDLLYGARSPDGIPFGAQLLGWLGSGKVNGHIIVDRPSDDWAGRVGPVTDLIAPLDFDPTETVAMICGPEIMMRFVIQALEARGIDEAAMWVSMERNMKCGIGWCGHCQLGPVLICRDGPVFPVERMRGLMARPEL